MSHWRDLLRRLERSVRQKAFHYLLAGAAYVSVIEKNTTNTDGLREQCEKYYHGFDDDNVGVVTSFLDGKGRFAVLWDEDKITSGFGDLSGLSHDLLEYSVLRPTLKAPHIICGRSILEKARACIKDSKKYLAYWMEFLVDDKLPSGMSEENALSYVVKRAKATTSVEVVGDDEADDEG